MPWLGPPPFPLLPEMVFCFILLDSMVGSLFAIPMVLLSSKMDERVIEIILLLCVLLDCFCPNPHPPICLHHHLVPGIPLIHFWFLAHIPLIHS